MYNNYKTIMDYWRNKTNDIMCYNCSYYFVNNLCPCKLQHIIRELKQIEVLNHD